MTDHGKWQDDPEAWQEHHAQDGGPHEIPGMPPCICSRCVSRRGQAARIEQGKAAAAMELAAYKRRLAEAMDDLDLSTRREPLIMPDTPVYGVMGPALSSGYPPGGFVRVTEVSPGVWRPDPAGQSRVPVPVIDEPDTIMIPASPMPDCTCANPQSRHWAVHGTSCPARKRLIAIGHAAAAAAAQSRAAGQDEPPEDPVEAWWRVTHLLGRGLTYRQLVARVPDQPPGMCAACRLMPAVRGRSWCEDCAEVTDAAPGHEPKKGCQCGCQARVTEGNATVRGVAERGNRRSARPLYTMITLGVACVVLAMAGVTPLIIPGVVLLGASLTMILKGEWK